MITNKGAHNKQPTDEQPTYEQLITILTIMTPSILRRPGCPASKHTITWNPNIAQVQLIPVVGKGLRFSSFRVAPQAKVEAEAEAPLPMDWEQTPDLPPQSVSEWCRRVSLQPVPAESSAHVVFLFLPLLKFLQLDTIVEEEEEEDCCESIPNHIELTRPELPKIVLPSGKKLPPPKRKKKKKRQKYYKKSTLKLDTIVEEEEEEEEEEEDCCESIPNNIEPICPDQNESPGPSASTTNKVPPRPTAQRTRAAISSSVPRRSARIASRGLGSGFTPNGRRFSQRLAAH